MSSVRAAHVANDRFTIDIRGHRIEVDQPVADGGDDTAPTPTELLIASLASCVAFYARRYLSRHDLPTEGLAVRADYAFGSRPARVAEISVELEVPPGVPEDRRPGLLAVASRCTVHTTLEQAPEVRIALVEPATV